ncbi:hypothetical protein BJ912DRAFT_974756, partial [Pholiota molesta]
PPGREKNLDGKTIIACKHFARMGAGKLIMASALAKIKEETGHKNTELYILDLANFASVKAFAQRFTQEEIRLTFLSNFPVTEDGWEPTLQVNVIATSLLALLLLPKMVETAKIHHTTPRIVVVSSEVHYWTTLSPEAAWNDKDYIAKTIKHRYEDSKLLDILFTRALNERLRDRSIIVNTVNPGFCISGIRRSLSGFILTFAIWLMEVTLARTAEEGSRQLVWAAIGHEEKEDELRGAYISLAEVSEPSDFVLSEQGSVAQDKIWNNLIDELTKIEPKVQDVVKDYLKE